MRALALIIVLGGVAGEAQAAQSFNLDPPVAQEGQVVSLRVESTFGCTNFGAPVVTRDGEVVTAAFFTDDGREPGPCFPERTTPRLHSLGTFARGNFTVHVQYCGALPQPYTCSTGATLPLVVAGVSSTAVTVPTLSGATVILLGFTLMVIGAVAPRRR